MSDQTPTPRTAKAIQEYHQWAVRNLQATMRGSHLDSDDPKPPDGWATAIQLERELAAAISERDADRRFRFKLIELLHKHGQGETDEQDGERIAEMVERIIAERDEARAEAAELRERLDKLAAFKTFVHRRLGEGGVPSDPKGEHAERGCRVGQRLKWLFDNRDQLRERVERLRRALEYYAGAPWVAHHGPWHNANFADVADKALAETEPKGEA